MSRATEGRTAYEAVAEELSGDSVLDELDQGIVQLAQQYARRSHRKWPPRPQANGWTCTVRSYVQRGTTP